MSEELLLMIDCSGGLRCLAGSEEETFLRRIARPQAVYRCSRVDLWRDLSPEAREKLKDHPFAGDPLAFWADMSPVDPEGSILGPFASHAEGCAKERAWLKARNLPLPEESLL